MKHIALLTAAMVLACAGGSGRAAEYEARTYADGAGRSLPYRLLLPDQYSPTAKYPLVLFFHGAGERGADNKAQLLHGTSLFLKSEHRRDFPCFVLAPQCPAGQQWVDMPWGTDSGVRPAEPSASMRLALEAVRAVAREYSIDTNRLYVTGLSMGGFATWDCVTRHPGLFAAAAPVCGGGDDKTVTPEAARVPVWAFHSDDDTVVKVKRTRDMIQAMRAAGGKPKYFEYFGLGHFSWGRAYGEPELLPWMFAQRRGHEDAYALKTPAPELPAVARFPDDSAFPGEGPIRKMDWFKNLWRERRLKWWNDRQKDRGAVVFLGDSITQGWGSLAKDFPDLKVANRGISGDVTRGVLCRLKEDVLDLDPKAVVLLIGTNDLEENGDPEVIARNVRRIVAACHSRFPDLPVVVCKVMPSHSSKKRPAEKIQRLNALVDEVVKAGPPCVGCDTYSIFADDQGNAKPSEFPDLLHPNAAGYAKFAEALRPVFAQLKLAGRAP